MANEIRVTYNTGATLYILVFNAAGQVWDQTNDGGAGSFEAYAAASIDNYDVILSEIATASGQYRGTFPPNIDTGAHGVVAYLQTGASPAITDARLGQTATMHWDTTANTEIDDSALHIHEAAIQAKTDNLPGDPADASVIAAAFAVTDGKVDAVQTTANTISGYTDILDDGTNGNAAIKAEVEGLAGAAMRGTDSAATAIALAATEVKIDTLQTTANTISGYADKIDDGTDGLTAIKAEVEGLAGAAMRGTDSAALASICTETRLGKLDATVSSRAAPSDITTSESNIRGVDSDTLKTLSDQGDLQGTLANQTTLLARIGTFTGTGVNTILGFLKSLASKIASTPSDVGGTFSAATDSLEAISEAVNTIGGTGAVTETYTCTDNITGLPIDGVTIWVTTDLAGANVIDSGSTNTAGQWSFKHDLPSGTPLYIWRQMAGYTFDDPDEELSS